MKIFTYKAGGGQKYSFSAQPGPDTTIRIYSFGLGDPFAQEPKFSIFIDSEMSNASAEVRIETAAFLWALIPAGSCSAAEKCSPYHRVEDMFRSFKTFQMDSS